MPLYDFVCGDCGHAFEARRPMDSAPEAPCPQCGQPARRQFSPNVNFQFKGQGFYITDYRGDQYKKDAAKEKEGAAAPATPAAKTDPAPATKSGGGSTEATSPGKTA